MAGNGKKRKPGRPPLSAADKLIYYAAFPVSFVLFILLSFRFDDLRAWIAFRDPTVITYSDRSSALLILPLMMYLLVSAITFFCAQLYNKTPIFGNKKVSYGRPPWDGSCYPLFDKRRKTVRRRPSELKFRRHMRILWCAGLLLTLALAPLSLCGRDCLYQDYSVGSFNALNHSRGKTYTESDYSRLTLQTRYVSGYRQASYWEYETLITMDDGESFCFSSHGRWKIRTHNFRLDTMAALKQRVPPEAITVRGANDVDRVAKYCGMDEEQTRRLHELFETQRPNGVR